MSVHPFKQQRLSDVLISKNYLTSDQLSPFSEIEELLLPTELLKNNLITQPQLTEALAELFHLEYIDLDGFSVSQELFSFLPAPQAYQYYALPYKKACAPPRPASRNPIRTTSTSPRKRRITANECRRFS